MESDKSQDPQCTEALSEDQGDRLNSRLERYGKAAKRSREMAAYCRSIGDTHRFMKLADCGSTLLFHHYFTKGLLKLVKAYFCKSHLLCPLCAIRRGGKQLRRFLGHYESLRIAAAGGGVNLNPQLITLTTKNGEDLAERVQHLQDGLAILGRRTRDAKRGKGQRSEWGKVLGVVGSIEVTNQGRGWHVHTHLFVLASSPIDSNRLSEEWSRITSDSFIIDVSEIPQDQDPLSAFCEVLKYAMKFSDLSLADNYYASKVLKRKRLFFATGLFFGIPEPDKLVDDPLLDLPYLELLYRYHEQSGYNLHSWETHDPSPPSGDPERQAEE